VTRFKKKTVIERKMCIWFPLKMLSETFFILKRIERGMIKKYMLVVMQSTRFLVRF